MSIKKLVYLS